MVKVKIMDTIHKQLMKFLEEALEGNHNGTDDFDIEQVISNVTPKVLKAIKDSLEKSAPSMLSERRKLAKEFEERNIARWFKAFDILETHIVICMEAGEEFNKSYRPQAAQNNDLVFDLVFNCKTKRYNIDFFHPHRERSRLCREKLHHRRAAKRTARHLGNGQAVEAWRHALLNVPGSSASSLTEKPSAKSPRILTYARTR
jgi:hypothetical protein